MKNLENEHLDLAMRDYLQQKIVQAVQEDAGIEGRAERARRLPEESIGLDGKATAPKESIEGHMEVVLRQDIVQTVSSVLKIPENQIDIKAKLGDFANDSILITEVMRRISDRLKLKIPPTFFFEADHVDSLTELIFKRYKDKLAPWYEAREKRGKADNAGVRKAVPGKDQNLVSAIDTAIPFDVDGEVEAWILRSRSTSPLVPHPISPRKIHAGAKSAHAPYEKEFEPVAIIGMDGKFPKSPTLKKFWENVSLGKDCIEEIPKDRWSWQDFYGDPQKEDNKTNVKWGGFIPEIDKFDPSFFKISPKEAEAMDPQHRLFMESVYKAIESAGYRTSSLSGKKISIFLGVNLRDYEQKIRKLPIASFHLTALAHMFCPNRLSFLLNINGPCQIIDTACSSSLVAIHRAILSLEYENCEMTIAGGSNLMMHPMMHLQYSKTGMICQDGRCKTFSKNANGYVRSDGVGAVLLKKLSLAQKDKDPVLAVIKGSNENHSGTAVALTAPNPNAQAELITSAIKKSNVDPRSISYIECHGTGTSLGDSIEINGLKMAFANIVKEKNLDLQEKNYCSLGSVKSNIGHAETAAGIAGLIKVVLAIQHKYLPKSLYCNEVNPMIDLENSPFSILHEGKQWQRPVIDNKEYPRIAGLSSFGAGGSNAHLIIEEYLPVEAKQPIAIIKHNTSVIIPLSARTAKQLQQRARDLLDFIGTAEQRSKPDNQAELKEKLQQQITTQLAKLLEIEPSQLDAELNFTDFGVGSLHLSNLFANINQEYGFKLRIEQWLQQNSIASLIDYCFSQEQAKQPQEPPTSESKNIDLVAMAYTLQVGREAMDKRLGFIVSSIEQLTEKLSAYIAGEQDIEEVYQGPANRNKESMDIIDQDDGMRKTIDKWIARKKHSKLLDLWVKGLELDWDKLYGDNKPQRISLPVYPFAKERYWIDSADTWELASTTGKVSVVHPLLHTNTSDLRQQSYSSIFNGEEFFLKGHQINGQKLLPAMVYLEMARAAVAQASPTQPESITLELHNTVWARPMAVTENKQVTIALVANNNEQIEYEIYSEDKEQEIVHCQGRATFSAKPAPAKLDIEQLKGQMRHAKLDLNSLSSAFTKMDINYGAGHQAVVEVHIGENQVVGKIKLPSSLSETQNHYVLHPSIMDAVLQSSTILELNPDDLSLAVNSPLKPGQPSLPFALESLSILSSCTQEMHAWIRYSEGTHSEDKMTKLDIDLCDQQGNVCVQMRGCSFRVLEGEIGVENHQVENTKIKPEEIKTGLHYFVPVWNSVTSKPNNKIILPASAQILLLGSHKAHLDWVQKFYPNTPLLQLPSPSSIDIIQAKLRDYSFDHLLWIAPDVAQKVENNHSINQQEQGVLHIFRIIKALLRLGYAHKKIQWTIITSKTQLVKKAELIQPTHAGIFGLVGSLAKEYPNWDMRLLDVDLLESVPADECLSLPWDKQGNGLAYRHGEWFRQGLARIAVTPTQSTPVYRQKGVYVVIGGAGGVGEVWSRFMAEHYQGKMVWIGRQEHNAAIENKINSLSLIGYAPLYISADATNLDSLQKAFEKIKKSYPNIHGVVHSATVLQDQSLTQMEESRFRASLSAQVDISVNMDRIFSGQALDFMLFSLP